MKNRNKIFINYIYIILLRKKLRNIENNTKYKMNHGFVI